MWVTHEHGFLIIAPQGEVTDKRTEGNAELMRLTAEAVSADKNRELLVIADLADVTFMNSTGLGELIIAYVHVRNRSGRFALCGVTKRVATLLEITKLSLVFDQYPNRAAARAAMTDQGT